MKKNIFILVSLCISINLNSQNFSKQILLDNYYGREAEFGDFDRDGDLDILMFYTFNNASGEGFTRIFENVNSEFNELELGFPIVEYFGSSRNGAINWVDFNNDGYLDVFLVVGKPFSIETKLYINNKNKTFTEKELNINDLVLGSCGPIWVDFDNDGDLDLTMFGVESSKYAIKIYENNIDTQELNAIPYTFDNVIIKSRMPWADFNNDGYLDLLVNELIDNSQTNLAIYKNNGDKTFTKIIYANHLGLNNDILNQTGDMRWGDYNSDGYLDILISGQHTDYTGSGITYLYKNNGNETFTKIDIDNVYGMTYDVSIEWGDYDNDGDLDILQTGEGRINGIKDRTRIYNNENLEFVNSNIENLLGVHQRGMSTSGDYNNDNKLDFLVLGQIDYTHHQIALYNNISLINNYPPQAPLNLSQDINNDEIILSWDKGNDQETSQEALSYNIYLIRDNDTIINPAALINGKRILPRIGNSQHNNFYKLKNLKAGTYKWGVQSIDNSFIGSSFSLEETFEITDNSSQLDDDNDGIMNDVDQCPNTPTGLIVNANGCFTLPPNNFTIEVKGETCPDKKNGEIFITPNETYNYRATINNTSHNFTNNSLTISNLAPGTYEMCITVSEDETFRQCYSIVVEAGKIVSGKASLTSKKASIEIEKGTSPYTIFRNGKELFKTSNPSFSLDVLHGDLIEVKTAKSCEGVFSKMIVLFEGLNVFPNPTDGIFEIALPESLKEVKITLFSTNSQRISAKMYSVVDGKVKLNIENHPAGIYFVKIHLETPLSFKIIKK